MASRAVIFYHILQETVAKKVSEETAGTEGKKNVVFHGRKPVRY